MVDINNKILTLDFREAIEKINVLKAKGYSDLILTIPILENGEYEQKEEIEKFNLLKAKIKDINLYLGNEINYHYTLIHRLKKGDLFTLNNSEYVLIKLPEKEKPKELRQLILGLSDYKIIISSISNNKYYTFNDLKAIKNLGFLYLEKLADIDNRKVKKMLKRKMVDYLVINDEVDFKISKRYHKIDDGYLEKLNHDNFINILK